MTSPTRVAPLVASENYHAKIANRFLPDIFDACSLFIGSKIYLKSNDRAKAFKDTVKIPNASYGPDGNYNFWLSPNKYSLYIGVRAQLGDKSVERTYRIGSLGADGTILESVEPYMKQGEAWDTAEVVKRLDEIEELQEKARKIKSSLTQEFQSLIPHP